MQAVIRMGQLIRSLQRLIVMDDGLVVVNIVAEIIRLTSKWIIHNQRRPEICATS